jgi:hypothetical protein
MNPTKDIKEAGSWADELQRIQTNLIAEVNKWNMYVPSAEAEAEIHKSVQAIVEANKKWVIGEDAPCEKGHKEYFDWCSYCSIENIKTELREEQRKAME